MIKYLVLSFALFSTAAQATCIISATPNNRFCLERIQLAEGDKLVFNMEGEKENNFKYQKSSENWVKITYIGESKKASKGTIKQLDSKGNVKKDIEIQFIEKNHLDGVNKLGNILGSVKF